MIRKILLGDVFEKIKEIPDETVDVVCTSPPYWGLRDYGTGKWEGGDPNCNHSAIRHKTREERGGLSEIQAGNKGGFADEKKWSSNICPDCGAKRIDLQLGMEPDFHDYLAKLNTLMRELRRVLKKTGTCWVNLGDTYSTVSGGMKDIAKGNTKQYGKVQYHEKGTGNVEVYGIDQTNMKKGLKPKCRVGIPERFYINCIDDGWIARNHIVWTKNNAMPSSVKDRFTNKWESVFFFAKEKKYYFNLDIVREKCITPVKEEKKTRGRLGSRHDELYPNNNKKGEKKSDDGKVKPHWNTTMRERVNQARKDGNIHYNPLGNPLGKNPGDVFEYRTGTDLKENYDGSKYDNQKEEGLHRQGLYKGKYADSKDINHPLGKNPGDIFLINTKAYKGAHFAVFPPALPEKILKCSCPKDGLVLDPFLGSGTTAWVAQQLNLNWIGIELNEEYAKIAKDRLGLNNSLGDYL